MKACILLFCGLGGILAAGCNHPIASGAGSTAIVPALTDATAMAVPLPTQTPFDGNPKARAAYLEYYAMGYQLTVTSADYASPGCLCTAEGDAERFEASMSGFYAGKEAGSAALAKKRLQNQAPTTATAGTPTATPPPRQR